MIHPSNFVEALVLKRLSPRLAILVLRARPSLGWGNTKRGSHCTSRSTSLSASALTGPRHKPRSDRFRGSDRTCPMIPPIGPTVKPLGMVGPPSAVHLSLDFRWPHGSCCPRSRDGESWTACWGHCNGTKSRKRAIRSEYQETTGS